mmetsp:Transcript_34018/g.97245  ORF Transcript_34018/g.97245 Transcript_34018/m.97245 type:complete len:210 (+) Transcript_34018:1368-1997(+)
MPGRAPAALGRCAGEVAVGAVRGRPELCLAHDRSRGRLRGPASRLPQGCARERCDHGAELGRGAGGPAPHRPATSRPRRRSPGRDRGHAARCRLRGGRALAGGARAALQRGRPRHLCGAARPSARRGRRAGFGAGPGRGDLHEARFRGGRLHARGPGKGLRVPGRRRDLARGPRRLHAQGERCRGADLQRRPRRPVAGGAHGCAQAAAC